MHRFQPEFYSFRQFRFWLEINLAPGISLENLTLNFQVTATFTYSL